MIVEPVSDTLFSNCHACPGHFPAHYGSNGECTGMVDFVKPFVKQTLSIHTNTVSRPTTKCHLSQSFRYCRLAHRRRLNPGKIVETGRRVRCLPLQSQVMEIGSSRSYSSRRGR